MKALLKSEGRRAPADSETLATDRSRRRRHGIAPADLRSVLFLSATAADSPADAVRDAALDLGAQSELPVLLLDLSIPANRQYRAFAAAGLLEPRMTPPGDGPPGFAVLHFERVRGTRLFVSRVSPDPTCFADITWALDSSGAIERLRSLFGAVVIAGPELAHSTGGLRLATCVDGVVLVLLYRLHHRGGGDRPARKSAPCRRPPDGRGADQLPVPTFADGSNPLSGSGTADIVAEAQVAHVARGPAGSPGRTIIIITLSGGELAQREALADRVVAASRDSLAAPAPENRLAAVFAHLSQAAPRAAHAAAALVELEAPLSTGTVLPAEAVENRRIRPPLTRRRSCLRR